MKENISKRGEKGDTKWEKRVNTKEEGNEENKKESEKEKKQYI